MVVGVNGTGKTTTIGKLAWHLLKERSGLSVIVAAADTYRAAAIEQLESGPSAPGPRSSRATPGAIPARSPSTRSPPPDARGADVVIVDTAGRLHTQDNLMEELAKVRRVTAQAAWRAPRTRR